MYPNLFKRIIDFFISFIAIICLSPLFLIIPLLIKLETKGPAFFLQERLGRNGKVFQIIKFRSMRVGKMNQKDDFENYHNNPRVTKVGKFIRKTSLDEIPQVINILKGEMAFIGPRPPLVYYPKAYSDYTDYEKKRFSVKPGLSGLTQVRNRFIDDWNHNIPIDIEYVENLSFMNDCKLFLLSFKSFFMQTK